MPFGVGATELIILLVIVLIIFGPKKLPQLGRSLGGGLREFKNSVSGKGGSDDDDDEPEVIEGPDRSNVTTAAAASDEETETARRQREAKTADAS